MGKLTGAAWVPGPAGLVTVVGSVLYLRGHYGMATVAGRSMEPTYAPGSRVVYERGGGEGPGRGDVVLYRVPGRCPFDGSVVRRVVGAGGGRVVCRVGAEGRERLVVNGRPLTEPYVRDGVVDGTRRPYDVKVPKGRLFLLGDHRSLARDSRAFADDQGGTVPVGAVEGRMTGDWTGVVVPAVGAFARLVVTLAGLGCAVAARGVRRRPEARTELWPSHL
ncbi:signal peptidase I [Streptomyces sp. NPDC006134]|uniref:signal peptidase I n=1 Tax=Streptomyces sp. NPDC006134 TaxID=3154467 RepID=UPI003403E7FB